MVLQLPLTETCWHHQEILDWAIILATLIAFCLVILFINFPLSLWDNWLSLNKKNVPQIRKTIFWGLKLPSLRVKQSFAHYQTTTKFFALFFSFLFNFYFFWMIIYCLYSQSLCFLPTFYWIILIYFIFCPFLYSFMKCGVDLTGQGTHLRKCPHIA